MYRFLEVFENRKFQVDSFSYGMFLYELVSLKQPYDRQEQMKDFILEGGRPFLTDKVRIRKGGGKSGFRFNTQTYSNIMKIF